MKKLILIIAPFISVASYAQITALTSTTPQVLNITRTTFIDSVIGAEFGTRNLAMMHKDYLFGNKTTGEVRIGFNALLGSSHTEIGNTAIGYDVYRSITSGSYNIGFGYQSGYNIAGAAYGNIIISGYRGMFNQTAGDLNIAIGWNQEQHSLTGSGQMAIAHLLFAKDANEVTGASISAGRIGIANNNPHASAVLDVTSLNKGLLIPRMTQVQRDAISSPAAWLQLICTDCTATDASTGVLQVWNGSTWKNAW